MLRLEGARDKSQERIAIEGDRTRIRLRRRTGRLANLIQRLSGRLLDLISGRADHSPVVQFTSSAPALCSNMERPCQGGHGNPA